MMQSAGLSKAIAFAVGTTCIVACPRWALADSADDVRAKVIAHLRTFKEIPDNWSHWSLRNKIGMAQVELRDLEGARTTLRWVLENRDSTASLMEFLASASVGCVGVGTIKPKSLVFA